MSKGWNESRILKLFSEVQWPESKESSGLIFLTFQTEFSILPVRKYIPLCCETLTFNCFLVSRRWQNTVSKNIDKQPRKQEELGVCL